MGEASALFLEFAQHLGVLIVVPSSGPGAAER
jgi:hypothetical protein